MTRVPWGNAACATLCTPALMAVPVAASSVYVLLATINRR